MQDTALLLKYLLDAHQECSQYILSQPERFFFGINADAPSEGKRFKSNRWTQDVSLRFIKNLYLTLCKHIDLLKNDIPLEPALKRRVHLFLEQFKSSVSPVNHPFISPEIVEATLATNGQNWLDGYQLLKRDFLTGRHLLTIEQVQKDQFAIGKNIACTAGDVIYQNKLMQVIEYRPLHRIFPKPVLFIPPWINKYYILDLQPENSLVRWLVQQGHHVFMISWVNPNAAHKNCGFLDYLLQGALQAIKTLHARTESKIHAVGYCSGGTLLGVLAALLAQKNISILQSATFFTTLFDFSDPGALKPFIDKRQFHHLDTHMAKDGYLSGKVLTSVFNVLRADDLIWSAFLERYLQVKRKKPSDFLYWNDDSVNVPYALQRDFIHDFYLQNKLIQGKISLCDEVIDLTRITVPCYFLSAQEDHLIPWASSYKNMSFIQRGTFVLSTGGHVAGVINPPHAQKYGFYYAKRRNSSAVKFMQNADFQTGSWWQHWQAWLTKTSGKKIAAEKRGKPVSLMPAPGSYVKKRL